MHKKVNLVDVHMDDTVLTPTYAARGLATGVPKYEVPDSGMSPNTAYHLIHDELMLDGNSRLNLATATIARNIGLAFFIASLSKVGHSAIPTILAYTILGALAAVPYAVWRKRQMA